MPKDYARLDPQLVSNIPKELRVLKQWVAWRLVMRHGRPNKVPIQPLTGHSASSTEPSHWTSFQTALDSAKQPENHGLGFVFTEQDPYVGVDIDDCRDPDTGKLGDWAQLFIKSLDSYTEVSPSGTGVKIILRAQLPGQHNRRNKIEMYAKARYFTITGVVVPGTPAKINDRQQELSEIYVTIFGEDAVKQSVMAEPLHDALLPAMRSVTDDQLIERALAATNGPKFLRLWDAKIEEYGNDHSRADAALCALLAYWTRRDAERIDRLFRRSKLMREKWDERRGTNTYGENTVRNACAMTTAVYDPSTDATCKTKNDINNAEIFVQLHGSEYLWCAEWKTWLAWNCNRWEAGSDLKLLHAAEDVSVEMFRRARANPDPDDKRQAANLKWAVEVGDRRRIDSIDIYARRRLVCHSFEMDRDPYLLCCANGVLDLRTGELHDGTQAERITRTNGVNYQEQAHCPLWDKFLREIMKEDEEMIQYLWRVVGYCLTGDVTERAFFLLHGNGRNGKTTFVEVLQSLLGPDHGGYAQKARFTTFLKKNQSGGVNDDIAHLAGARLVIANEADANAPLDTSVVKELTGNDSVRARFLYGKEFQFRPQFKLMLVTNHVPPIRESTYALWDRLHYVGFDFRVPDESIDRLLQFKLLHELPGILAKAVRASMEWQKIGLQPPDKILKGKRNLEIQMDYYADFLTEKCTLETGEEVIHKDLYGLFQEWARAQGYRKVPSSRALAGYLREKGFLEGFGHDNMKKWKGLCVKTSV